jgi:hypothetical protein
MAFDMQKLTPHDAASKGSKIWTYYDGTDSPATMVGAGYFNDASLHLQVGDVLILTNDTTMRLALVTAVVQGTSVTVTSFSVTLA